MIWPIDIEPAMRGQFSAPARLWPAGWIRLRIHYWLDGPDDSVVQLRAVREGSARQSPRSTAENLVKSRPRNQRHLV
jgi:hypothetical protein